MMELLTQKQNGEMRAGLGTAEDGPLSEPPSGNNNNDLGYEPL